MFQSPFFYMALGGLIIFLFFHFKKGSVVSKESLLKQKKDADDAAEAFKKMQDS